MDRNRTNNNVNLVKMINNMAALSAEQNTKILTVLVLSGAVSPVHRMHIHAFEIAKQHLHSLGHVVVGGFICPSSEGYVNSKLKQEAISLAKRNMLCQIATASSDWIEVCDWGWANAISIIAHVKELLKGVHGRTFDVRLVAGADHAARHHLYNVPIKVVCIGRPGDTELLRKQMEFVQTTDDFILTEDEAEDISSTKIRTLILQNRWAELAKLVHPEVLAVLQKEGFKIFNNKNNKYSK